jgi:hypothetical protein
MKLLKPQILIPILTVNLCMFYDGVGEEGAKENICTEAGVNEWRLEETA